MSMRMLTRSRIHTRWRDEEIIDIEWRNPIEVQASATTNWRRNPIEVQEKSDPTHLRFSMSPAPHVSRYRSRTNRRAPSPPALAGDGRKQFFPNLRTFWGLRAVQLTAAGGRRRHRRTALFPKTVSPREVQQKSNRSPSFRDDKLEKKSNIYKSNRSPIEVQASATTNWRRKPRSIDRAASTLSVSRRPHVPSSSSSSTAGLGWLGGTKATRYGEGRGWW